MPILDPHWLCDRSDGKQFIAGLVWGHSGFPDGTKVHTTAVVQLFADQATTQSGTIYKLGRRFEHQDDAIAAGVLERWFGHDIYPGPNFGPNPQED